MLASCLCVKKLHDLGQCQMRKEQRTLETDFTYLKKKIQVEINN